MAAPLPSGLGNIRVVPQAPAVDPQIFAPDVLKALQVGHSSILLGQELQNLDNMQRERDLRAAQIKLEKAKIDVEQMHADEMAKQLPTLIPALTSAAINQKLNAAKLAAAGDELALRGVTAAGKASLPEAQVNVSAQELKNAEAAAKGASTFAGLSPVEKATAMAQGQTYGQTAGGMLVPPTAANAGTGPLSNEAVVKAVQQRKFEDAQGISDWQIRTELGDNGEMKAHAVRLNRDGSVYAKTDTWVQHPPPGVKSAGQISREAADIKNLDAMAAALGKAIDAYTVSGSSSFAQQLATMWANSSPTGLFSAGKRYLGQLAQSENTKEIAAKVQTFNNLVANGLFGAALNKDESARLNAMAPSAADLSNPEAMKTKLRGMQEIFDAKLKSLQEQGATTAAGKPITIGAAVEARKTGAAAKPQGVPVTINGRTGYLQRTPSGKPYLVPIGN